MRAYIGVDLDGTNVRMTKIGETGAILQIVKEPTEIGEGMEQVASKIISMIEYTEGHEAIADIGMGVPGPIDAKNDKMTLATNLPGFGGYPITSRIEEHFHVPAFLDNNVNIAGMGEAPQGTGKGKDIVCYVTISMGTGSALVINQKVIAERNEHAGKIVNPIINRNREKMNYLNVGAAKNETSGTVITCKGKAAFDEGAVQYAGGVFDLARKRNTKALEICDAVAYDLATTFPQIAYAVDPGVFVVGGGIMKGKDVFFDKMENYFRNMIYKGMQTAVFIEAELDEPGIIGAAMLSMAYVKGQENGCTFTEICKACGAQGC